MFNTYAFSKLPHNLSRTSNRNISTGLVMWGLFFQWFSSKKRETTWGVKEGDWQTWSKFSAFCGVPWRGKCSLHLIRKFRHFNNSDLFYICSEYIPYIYLFKYSLYSVFMHEKDIVSIIAMTLLHLTQVTQEELDVEKSIRKCCGVDIKTFWGHTLYHRDDLPFSPAQ